MTHDEGGRRSSANDALARVVWRKSSFSGGGGSGGGGCVELAPLVDGRIGVRDSKHRAGGALVITQAELAAWVAGCKAGEFDDLTR